MALTSEEEQFVRDLKTGGIVELILKTLRVNNPAGSGKAAIFVDNQEAATAVHIVNGNSAGNPCLKCTQPAPVNAACVELSQGDGEDAIVALGADIRAEQFIADGSAPHIALKPGGSIQGSNLSDTAPSPEFYDLIRWDGDGHLDFVIDGKVKLRISARGVETPPKSGRLRD